jgi:hypothetical protein
MLSVAANFDVQRVEVREPFAVLANFGAAGCGDDA